MTAPHYSAQPGGRMPGTTRKLATTGRLAPIDQLPSWMRGFNSATILPARQSRAYRLREYYALTGLSPRLERHYNVALGI